MTFQTGQLEPSRLRRTRCSASFSSSRRSSFWRTSERTSRVLLRIAVGRRSRASRERPRSRCTASLPGREPGRVSEAPCCSCSRARGGTTSPPASSPRWPSKSERRVLPRGAPGPSYPGPLWERVESRIRILASSAARLSLLAIDPPPTAKPRTRFRGVQSSRKVGNRSGTTHRSP